MAKRRVFVSFDFDKDRALRDLIIGQSKLADSPFSVADHSLKEAAPQKNWEAKAHRAIARSEIFVVMLGSRTRWAGGVLKEIKMAQDLGKPRVQIIGYQRGSASWRVRGAGRVYKWSWDNLKQILK